MCMEDRVVEEGAEAEVKYTLICYNILWIFFLVRYFFLNSMVRLVANEKMNLECIGFCCFWPSFVPIISGLKFLFRDSLSSSRVVYWTNTIILRKAMTTKILWFLSNTCLEVYQLLCIAFI